MVEALLKKEISGSPNLLIAANLCRFMKPLTQSMPGRLSLNMVSLTFYTNDGILGRFHNDRLLLNSTYLSIWRIHTELKPLEFSGQKSRANTHITCIVHHVEPF